jgi:putative transposase
LSLHAWAFLANHYHLVVGFEEATVPHRVFLRHFHREIAVRFNELDSTSGRKVIYQFWDTELTFEKSYLARLNYVHQNPVHHGLVPVARDYAWCSARWFETNARPAFVRSVYSFRTDRVKVADDFCWVPRGKKRRGDAPHSKALRAKSVAGLHFCGTRVTVGASQNRCKSGRILRVGAERQPFRFHPSWGRGAMRGREL